MFNLKIVLLWLFLTKQAVSSKNVNILLLFFVYFKLICFQVCTKLVHGLATLNAVGIVNGNFAIVTSELDVYFLPLQNLNFDQSPYLKIDTIINKPQHLHQLWHKINFVVDRVEKLFTLADENVSMFVSRQSAFSKQNPVLALRALPFSFKKPQLCGFVNQTLLKQVDVILSAGKNAYGFEVVKVNQQVYSMVLTEHEELLPSEKSVSYSKKIAIRRHSPDER